jgi:lysophospholipase L1-like esterase
MTGTPVIFMISNQRSLLSGSPAPAQNASCRGMAGKGIPAKRLVFWAILMLVTALACELGARLVFAVWIDSKIVLYGTPLYRSEINRLPSTIMAKVGYTPPTPAGYQTPNRSGTYAKFSPHEIKVDKDENGNRFHPTINGRGFRGAEFVDRKPPGTTRVVTLGASSTFGYHNRDDQTYPHYMQVSLNTARPEGDRFEVINLGIPHMDSDEIVSLFLNEAVPLRPDIVTFYEGWNDATKTADALGRHGPFDRRPDMRLLIRDGYRAIANHSLLAALLDSLFYYITESEIAADDLQRVVEQATAKFLANVSLIRQVCRTEGILFIMATQQARSQTIAREHIKGITFHDEAVLVREKLARTGKLTRREAAFLIHAGLMEGLHEWAAANQAPLADVIRALDADRTVLLTYVHASATGNRVIAHELAKQFPNGARRPVAGNG